MRYDLLYPFDLPPGEDSRLIRELLRLHRDWPADRAYPLYWEALVEQMPEGFRYPPELLRAVLYHCNNEGFLRGGVITKEEYTPGRLTRLGARMLRDEAALERRRWFPAVLAGLGSLIPAIVAIYYVLKKLNP